MPLEDIRDIAELAGMAENDPYPIRKLIRLTAEQAKRIAEFRWANRLQSENEAIRRLIERGLARKAKPGATKKHLGTLIIAAGAALFFPASGAAAAAANPSILLNGIAEGGEFCGLGPGNDPRTAKHRLIRDAIEDKLHSRGWCYGADAEADNPSAWHPCR